MKKLMYLLLATALVLILMQIIAGQGPLEIVAKQELAIRESRGPLNDKDQLPQTVRGTKEKAMVASPSGHPVVEVPSLEYAVRQADLGDPRYACHLARQLSRCRLGRVLSTTAQSRFEANVKDADSDFSTEIVNLETRAKALAEHCSPLLSTQFQKEWQYLAISAESGNAQSMFEFVVAPPIDLSRPLASLDAVTYYKEHAPEFIDRLVRMNSTEGLSLAYSASSGRLFLGADPVMEGNAEDVVRFGAALRQARPAGLSASQQRVFDDAWRELSPIRRRQLEDEGSVLGRKAVKLIPDDTDDLGDSRHECGF